MCPGGIISRRKNVREKLSVGGIWPAPVPKTTPLKPDRHTSPTAAVVQWNHAHFGVRGFSKRTGSNPVHCRSVGWASSLEATVS
ncbi:hypothetical protein E2C01_068289 [Portunus trituberculatus]|uniref:Uncharacterized protein n=1 Tax=Portunus trituberculatus TaxID=210409 RepID=A0A5B7HW37_PORTR|nr:hypothetical protein [Portunus trituberculatus]